MIACHSRVLYESIVYLAVINIRTIDGVVFDILTLCETPSVLMNLLRSRCVVVPVKFLKVLWYTASLVADWTGEWIYLSLSQ